MHGIYVSLRYIGHDEVNFGRLQKNWQVCLNSRTDERDWDRQRQQCGGVLNMCICHFCTVCVCLCVCGVSVCRVCASVSLCSAAFSEITVCLSSARRCVCVCVCAESSITVFASRLDSMYVVSSQCKKARRITAENFSFMLLYVHGGGMTY